MNTGGGVPRRTDAGGALPAPTRDDLQRTIRRLLAPGNGLLAADESMTTIARRFERVGIRSTEASRRAYREMLFTAPGIGEGISGVILFDETIRHAPQTASRFPGCCWTAEPSPGSRSISGRSRSRSRQASR